MSVEPSTGPEHDLLAPGPLPDAERAAVVRAVVRCHVLARLPPPRVIAWLGSVDAADRYAAAAAGGDPTPAVVALNGPGASARLRRAVVAPRAGVVGCAFGIGLGLGVGGLLITLPLWLPVLGLPFAGLLALLLVARRVLGGHPRVLSAVAIALALGFAAGEFALLGRLGRFPEGAFRLPDPLLRWVLPAVVGLVGLAGAAMGLGYARSRLRPGRARPDTVAGFAGHLASLPWGPGGGLRAVATPGVWDGPDALARVAPGWRPFPMHVVRRDPARGGGGPWRDLQRGRVRRRIVAIRPALRVLWKAYPGLVVAVYPPRELHAAAAGLHRTDGPALVWADGTPEYFLHGVRVPRSPALGDWSVEEIHEVPNSEARRIMIEAIGWDRYLREARLDLVADGPDPGNAPHRLELYDLPFEVFGPVRLLVMVNGSPDRSGAPRRYAEFVPGDIADPVDAAAWQYGVGADVYRDLQRRT